MKLWPKLEATDVLKIKKAISFILLTNTMFTSQEALKVNFIIHTEIKGTLFGNIITM